MDMILSIVMLAALALLAGAFWLWRRQGAVKQVWLMVLLAVVMLVNVAIWTIPDASGTAPLERAAAPE
jgi:drug/metabolite transporter superfamily protein YnfA